MVQLLKLKSELEDQQFSPQMVMGWDLSVMRLTAPNVIMPNGTNLFSMQLKLKWTELVITECSSSLLFYNVTYGLVFKNYFVIMIRPK